MHSFVQRGECVKQVPPAFVLMSEKQKERTRGRKLDKIVAVNFWAQCIWRKIEDIGLAPAHKNDDATQKPCRKFLTLLYLPKEHIPALFEKRVRNHLLVRHCLSISSLFTCFLLRIYFH